MDKKYGFRRAYLVFGQEESGYGVGRAPAGYVKIEVRDGRGKLLAMVQNLKEGQSGSTLKLYIIKSDNEKIVPVCAGNIPLKKNSGEIRWEFDPVNVASTGYGIDEFNIAAVLIEPYDRTDDRIICPMAAYKGRRLAWKDKLRAELYHIKNMHREEKEQYETDVQRDEEKVVEQQAADAQRDEEKVVEQQAADAQRDEEKTAKEQKADVKKEEEKAAKQHEIDMQRETDVQLEIGENNSELTDVWSMDLDAKNADCIFSGSSFCIMQASDKSGNPCAKCQINTDRKDVRQEDGKNEKMIKFREYLDRYFEKYNPFQSKRKDYIWWKLNNPVHLNNILYRCGIKTPLLFNPVAMMAHFKYRYLIIGIYTGREIRREYIVCGVPGVYGIDERPFGNLCRWVQVEGSKPKYGAFGYWLVYIDPGTGNFLNLS